MKTLKERLQDWTDVDFAMYELGQVLGLISESLAYWECKSIIESNTPQSRELFKVLTHLKNESILDFDGEDKYRFRQ